MTSRPIVVPFGDSGVFVEIGGAPGLETSRRLRALGRRIRAATAGTSGWSAPIPAATSILVPVDPIEPGAPAAVEVIRAILDGPWEEGADHEAAGGGGASVDIPVCYGGEGGPDLEAVASLTGMAPEKVIEAHAATAYTALFIGFAPGFAYLGPLAAALVLPRRDSPREHVPAGSVAIAGPQTAIYPVDSPGGWWILGRTSTRVWDPDREPPALLGAGTRVRFIPERP